MVTLWLNEPKMFFRSHVLINKISQVSADSRSFMKLPLFQDHAVLWMKVAAQERKKEQVWPCSKYGIYVSPLHPTIPKYPTVSLIWVAAEPFSEACCSACIGLFVPSSSTASSAIPAKHHWPTNSGPAVMGSKAHISSVSSAARCALPSLATYSRTVCAFALAA